MKKIWIILLICIVVIIISLVVTLLKKRKVELTSNNIKSIHFSYSTGTMMYAYARYNIDYKDNKYIASIKPNNIEEEKTKEIEIDKNTLKKIVNVLNKYEVYCWNNFHKNDKNVLDGNSFSFYLKTKDNNEIDASGYMRWPKNYRNVRDELDNIFEKLYKNN